MIADPTIILLVVAMSVAVLWPELSNLLPEPGPPDGVEIVDEVT